MPYCWNCDTEATHVYHNHRKERRYLCTTCADAFNVGYLYGQEGGDDATLIDTWGEEEDDTPEQARPASPDNLIPGIFYHLDRMEHGSLFPQGEHAANLKHCLEQLGTPQLTLPDGRTVALRAEHTYRANYTIDITSDAGVVAWEAGYEEEAE
jgi:hypothetical protein